MGIIDDVKSVTKVIQQIDNVELYRKILDLHAEIRNLVDENQDLKSEILSLKEALKTKESLQFECNAYWTKSNAGTRGDGPFCSKCWDKEGRIIRMLSTNSPQYHLCPSCQKSINTSGRPDDPVNIRVDSRFDPDF